MITIQVGIGGILWFRLLDSGGAAVTGKVDGDFSSRRYVTQSNTWDDLSGTISEGEAGWYSIAVTGAEADMYGQAVAYFSDGTNEAHVSFMIEPSLPGYARTVVTDTAYATGFTVAADSGMNEDDINGLWAVRRGHEDIAPRKVIQFDDATGAYLVAPSWSPAPTDGDTIDLYRQGNDFAQGGDISSRLTLQNDSILSILNVLTWNDGTQISGTALSSTTVEVTDLIGYTGESPVGMWLYRDSDRVARLVTGFDSSTGVFTFTPEMADFVPASGWTFRLGRIWNPYAQNALIANAVWDEDTGGHAVSGSFSDFLTFINGSVQTAGSNAEDAKIMAVFSANALMVGATDPLESVNFDFTVTAVTDASNFQVSLVGDILDETVIGSIVRRTRNSSGTPVAPGTAVVVTAFNAATGDVTVSPAMDSALAVNETVRFYRPIATLLDHPDGVDTGFSHARVLRKIGAAVVAKSSGADADGGSQTMRNLSDTADEFTATYDDFGNRTDISHTD